MVQFDGHEKINDALNYKTPLTHITHCIKTDA